jgi:hypothetical protein
MPPVQNSPAYFRRLAGRDIYAPSIHNATLLRKEPNYTIAIKKSQRVVSGPKLNVLKKWKESFSQLKAALMLENYNAEVVLPSPQVIGKVIAWIQLAYSVAPHLNAPEVVPDTEGGLDIEWSLDSQFVSIHIGEDNLNRIFVKDAAGYRSEPLNKTHLQAILN